MNSKADSQRPEVYLNYKLRKKNLEQVFKKLTGRGRFF